MSHFLKGLRDERGELASDEDGIPYCAGSGIKKEDTVREAVQRLQSRSLITVYPGRAGWPTPANVYMPLSEQNLAELLIEGGAGVLPVSFSYFVPGEHVVCQRLPWRVVASEGLDLAAGPKRRRGGL